MRGSGTPIFRPEKWSEPKNQRRNSAPKSGMRTIWVFPKCQLAISAMGACARHDCQWQFAQDKIGNAHDDPNFPDWNVARNASSAGSCCAASTRRGAMNSYPAATSNKGAAADIAAPRRPAARGHSEEGAASTGPFPCTPIPASWQAWGHCQIPSRGNGARVSTAGCRWEVRHPEGRTLPSSGGRHIPNPNGNSAASGPGTAGAHRRVPRRGGVRQESSSRSIQFRRAAARDLGDVHHDRAARRQPRPQRQPHVAVLARNDIRRPQVGTDD